MTATTPPELLPRVGPDPEPTAPSDLLEPDVVALRKELPILAALADKPDLYNKLFG